MALLFAMCAVRLDSIGVAAGGGAITIEAKVAPVMGVRGTCI
jgi:hypothetical protein